MKIRLLLLSLLLTPTAFAQMDLMQSAPSLQWKTIENNSVYLIYPDSFEKESRYVANLIEHYSKVVGVSFDIPYPRKFPLIIRTEVAAPNGYVTLAPRRSEWFTSSMFFPSIGSSEWLQTLSIHEYRHVNQIDYFTSGSGTRIYRLLMGEFGEQIAMAMALPSWFLEGDAVWAETKFTDGGRGRSPRFLSRLKALVVSNQIPKFDEFLSGSYKTDLPNQYVYGYALVSYGRQKFGEDVWKRIISRSADFPHPLRFYSSFDHITGQRFEDFYVETMNDLKKKWAVKNSPATAIEDYRDNIYPQKVGDSLYYVNETLQTLPTIYERKNGQDRKIAEIPFSKSFMQIEFGKTHAVLTQFTPDQRYGHKGYSNLVLVDLNSGAFTQLTKGRRVYNPSFNSDSSKILAVDFSENQNWDLVEFDLNGTELRRVHLKDHKFSEARYRDSNKVAAILLNQTGHRSLVDVDLGSQSISQTLLPSSRNLIATLRAAPDQSLIFEGQYKGKNEIFRMTSTSLTKCTDSSLGAFTPHSDGQTVYYSQTDFSGSVIEEVPTSSCQNFSSNELQDFNYLGTDPSDNYNALPPVSFVNQSEMYQQGASGYLSQNYQEIDSHAFIPHSWGLQVARGFGLGFQADNYLRTFSTGFLIGSDAEEAGSFVNLAFDYKKHYPLLRLELETRNRKVTSYETDDVLEWEEKTAAVSTVIPFLHRSGLKNLTASLHGQLQYTDTANYQFNELDVTGSGSYLISGSSFNLALTRDSTARDLISPWLLSYSVRYDDATPTDSTGQLGSNRLLHEVILQTPAAFANDGFKFTFHDQVQNGTEAGYRFLPVNQGLESYVFSRGYTYKDVTQFQKATANYFFPIAYPNYVLSRYYYLRRLYGTLFYDSTLVSSATLPRQLDSYGAEARFESVFVRFIPLTFGGRVVHKIADDETVGEFFLATPVF